MPVPVLNLFCATPIAMDKLGQHRQTEHHLTIICGAPALLPIVFFNLCSGTYTVTVTDLNNCSTTRTVLVNQPTPLSSSALATDDYCGAICIGTASAFATGATPPYSYLWSNGQTASYIKDLCQGTYTVTVTDSLGCTTQTQTVNVGLQNFFPSLAVSISDDTIFCWRIGTIICHYQWCHVCMDTIQLFKFFNHL